MVDPIPDFSFKQTFPIASIMEAMQRKAQLEQQNKLEQQQQLQQGLQSIGQVGQTLVDKRLKVAQALALGKQFGIPDEQARLMTPEQVLNTGKALQPIDLPYQDKDGQIHLIQLRKGSKGLPSQGTTGTKPQQSQFTDSDGTPLYWDPLTKSYAKANVQPGVNPGMRKGDESAIADATLISNQIPNIKPMFDAYRTSKFPQLQATPVGRLMNPEGKQAENALKLAAFSFGGKNLTGQEKDVVFGALFPSWSDNNQSRDQKEKLLKDFMTGKIDLLEASNLLGPAGAPLKQMLATKMAQQPTSQTPQKGKQTPKAQPVQVAKSTGNNRSKFIEGAKNKGYSQIEAEHLADQHGFK